MDAKTIEIIRNEFEKRNNNGRMAMTNPALNWQKVTDEVAELNNRIAGNGYFKYAQLRIYQDMSHEQAAAQL